MVIREIIRAELDRVPEDRLEEVYEVVKFYSRTATQTNGSDAGRCGGLDEWRSGH
ncbi:MAG: hypothetical protein ACREA9_17880 [Pyrinomonadaceae bacterium]